MKQKYSSLDLMKWFFSVWCKRRQFQVICPLVGQEINMMKIYNKKLPKAFKDYTNSDSVLKLSGIYGQTPLIIQDPLKLDANPTDNLVFDTWSNFQIMFTTSSLRLMEIINLKQPLSSLFEPIDLST